MSAGSCRGVVASIVLFLLAFAGGCGGGGGVAGDAALLTLVPSVGTLSPEFDPEVTGYDLGMVVAPTLQWTPTARAIGSTITVQGVDVISGALSQAIALPIGRSSITVVVTASDGVTRRTYTVSVDRTSAALTGLSTDAGPLSPRLEAEARDYVVGPLLATETATFTARARPRATIAVNGVATLSGQPSGALPLAMGDTVVSVLVTAADGVTLALYTVVLVRTSAALSELTISEGTLAPAFDPGVTAYGMGPSLLGPTVMVTPTAEAPNATITVNGVVVASGTASAPLPLPMGTSEVTVVVTAAGDVATRTYQVVFDRTSAALTGLIASTGPPRRLGCDVRLRREARLLPETR
jgi:hypothetical protein